MGLREAEVGMAATLGLLALASVFYYRRLWKYIRLAKGGTRRLLVAFALLVALVALTMGVWATAFILWPAPRNDDARAALYAVLWLEHIGLVALIDYLYRRMTSNGS